MELDTPTNYSGATIFWAYILAALYFTATVLRTINSARGSKSNNQDNKKHEVPLFLTLLAISSFTTLSFHMLNILIQSYQQWAIRHNIPMPNGLYSCFGPDRIPLHLWNWSVTSTLFQDFGEAIVASGPRYLVASTGLWTTFYMASFMGLEGRRLGVPNLWAFFCLLEILPTSFSQTLFYMILSLQPQRNPRSAVRLSISPLWYGLVVAYALCLYVAASATGTWLVTVILVARLLLLFPLFLPLGLEVSSEVGAAREGTSDVSGLFAFNRAVALLFIGFHVFLVYREDGLSSVFEALQSHPAVKTLGYDLLHSLIAFLYWNRKGIDVTGVGERKMK